MLTPQLALTSIWKASSSELQKAVQEVRNSDWASLLPERGQSEACVEAMMTFAETYAKRIGEILG